MNRSTFPALLWFIIWSISCSRVTTGGQSGTEDTMPRSCLCDEIAPLFPIRATVTDIRSEYVALIAKSYPVHRATAVEAGVIITGPPDASIPDMPLNIPRGLLYRPDLIPKIGQAFGGSWDGSPICGFGCIHIDIGDEVLAYFSPGEEAYFDECPDYKSCFEESCSRNEDASVPTEVCHQECLAQTREACEKYEEEIRLHGSLLLTLWDDDLIVGINKDRVVSITPDELVYIQETIVDNPRSCREQFPNVMVELFRSDRKASTSNTSKIGPAPPPETSSKCQFFEE